MAAAVDPDLTELIAAHYRHCVSEEIRLDPEAGVHTRWIECTCVCGADTSVEVTGDREAALRLADAAHVALVVEQHTNRRTRELEAERNFMAANYVTAIGLRDIARDRAEKAEATIARAWAVLPNYSVESGGKATPGQIAWLEGARHVQTQLRTALEGKS